VAFLTAPVSVVVITRNEEMNIERCLGSVQWADEVVVVDSHSEDATRAKATALGARVVERDWPGFGAQKNFGVDMSRNLWILNIDADEAVTPQLAAEIAEVVRQDLHPAYRVRRTAPFMGRPLRHYGRAPREPGVVRLFRKDRARFDEPIVHEVVRVDGSVGWLRNPLMHYCYPTLTSYWQKIHYYAALEAQAYVARPPWPDNRWLRAAGKLGWMLVLRRGLLHGPSAWIWIAGQAYEDWLAVGEASRLRKRARGITVPA
jgi:glycosyltransferase involved in cell wall biosynthesis